ncbi:MAG: hypothetical protein IRY85_11340 [Micromonosporaceae bacterium]|nr:hypothetical protein [Micromonosporaceae bacterium]
MKITLALRNRKILVALVLAVAAAIAAAVSATVSNPASVDYLAEFDTTP